MTFTPCSPKHKSCSPAHADLVRSYRIERWRQEVQHEVQLDPRNVGERQFWKENGGHVVTFGDWLHWHKGERR